MTDAQKRFMEAADRLRHSWLNDGHELTEPTRTYFREAKQAYDDARAALAAARPVRTDAQVEALSAEIGRRTGIWLDDGILRAALAAAQAGAPEYKVTVRDLRGFGDGFKAGIEAARKAANFWTTDKFVRESWNDFPSLRALRPAETAESEPRIGWKLVPVEPTEEMIDAGCESNAYDIAVHENKKRHEDLMAKYPEIKPRETHGAAPLQTLPIVWKAMLDAAPAPPPSASDPAGAPNLDEIVSVIEKYRDNTTSHGLGRALLALLQRESKK